MLTTVAYTRGSLELSELPSQAQAHNPDTLSAYERLFAKPDKPHPVRVLLARRKLGWPDAAETHQ